MAYETSDYRDIQYHDAVVDRPSVEAPQSRPLPGQFVITKVVRPIVGAANLSYRTMRRQVNSLQYKPVEFNVAVGGLFVAIGIGIAFIRSNRLRMQAKYWLRRRQRMFSRIEQCL